MKELEFFTILKENESEEKAKEQLAKLKAEYADYNPVVSIFKGDDAFDGLKKHVEKTTDAFLVLQQGSRSLQDQLFRKFMINELVYSGHTPLIVIST
ncbi:MAG: hypothetical protein U5L96_06635 [Owenweeksia sp.]|nr:hypothetical protein [Owenweeksia sp.]